ncbi:energy-coupling factor ABC transporter substrate-binding protein [Mycolicibacterium goodii]|uniref:Cobalt transport protein CbiN n=1 Tax=Mycolicibacterium goodii TaxID=134601 RepID=A0A0K0X8W6_MYCGD|nr:hypothetical protein AFA91_20200 [Mycolicibacterium goodii]
MSARERRSAFTSRSALINLGLLALIALIIAVCVAVGTPADSTQESFVGTDTTAVESIESSHPDYKPWIGQLYAPPSAEIESGLFALQAALGAGVFGYALGALRRRRPSQGRTTLEDTTP